MVTIAIPAYKPEFLAEAIESALNQDYHNIELVIVDDCSPFDLDSIVRKYNDNRIRYYRNPKNLGKKSIVHNWNRCLELAKGEYFVLLCDDDVLMPNYVSEMLKLADKYPLCNVFHARRELIDERDGSSRIDQSWPEYESPQDYLDQVFLHDRKHTISEFMYRMDHVKKIKYLITPVGYYSDDVSLILFTQNGGVASSTEPLIKFRFSDSHITSNPKYNVGKAKAFKQFVVWVCDTPFCQPYKDSVIERYQRDSIYLLYGAQAWDKIRVLPYIDHSMQNRKLICQHFFDLLKKKTHL